MKFHSRTKQTQKLGFRTPDHFKAQTFGGPALPAGRQKPPQLKFNPAQFKTQHKG